jgi:hypothetical protein
MTESADWIARIAKQLSQDPDVQATFLEIIKRHLNDDVQGIILTANAVASSLETQLRWATEQRDRWYKAAGQRQDELNAALSRQWEWYFASSPPPVDTPLLMRVVYQTRCSESPSTAFNLEVEYAVCQIDGETGDLLTVDGDDFGFKFEDVVTHWAPIKKPPGETL